MVTINRRDGQDVTVSATDVTGGTESLDSIETRPLATY
jgi:hypothetical protein